MNRSLPLLMAAAAAALAGCIGYPPLELKPEQVAAQFAARTLDDPGLQTFMAANHTQAPASAGTWDLERLTLAAFYFSPALDIARADWALAQAGIVTAKQRPNPTLSLSPGYNATTRGISPWILGYTLDIPIETFGKRRHRVLQAQHVSDAARFNLAAVAWQVRSSVRRALIDVQSAREAAGFWQQREPLLAEAERLVAAQARAGGVAPADTVQALIALDQAKLAQRDAVRIAAQAQGALAEAIGIPASALAAADISFSGLDQAPAEISVAQARAQAAMNRADLLAGLAEFAAADEALRLEIARQYPDVHLTPAYFFDQAESKWEPAISVSPPILNQNRGPIAEAKAARAAAAARFADLQARVLAQVDQAVAAYGAARGSLGPLQSLRASIDNQVRLAQAQRQAGELSKVEITLALLDATRNSLTLLAARTQTETALAALEDATQSPLLVPAPLWSESPRRTAAATAAPRE